MNDAHTVQWSRAFAAGTVGAATLTAIHQLARAVSDDAPRMDVVGSRAVVRSIEAAGGTVPSMQAVEGMALAGDLVCNSAYYSLIACGRRAHVWPRAVALGLAAGIGAIVLPRRMGLGDPPHSHRRDTQVMTVAWYLLGALATAAAAKPLGTAAA
jgi:hypothetical protein